MNFEFDPAKSRANLKKHDIDFDEARHLWNDSRRVTFVARVKDEERLGIIGSYQKKVWCGIFTMREDRVRIISVRRTRKNEEKIYHNR